MEYTGAHATDPGRSRGPNALHRKHEACQARALAEAAALRHRRTAVRERNTVAPTAFV